MPVYNSKLLHAIKEFGYSIEEVSGLMRISEADTYKVLSGTEVADNEFKRRIAAILDKPVKELWPED